MNKRAVLLTAASLATMVAIALGFIACGGSGGSLIGSPPALVNVTLSDPYTCSNPGGPYSHVYVTLTDVQGSTNPNAADNDPSFIDLTPQLKRTPQQVDLLGPAAACILANLGTSVQLSAGNYQQFRIFLASNASAGSIGNNQCGNIAANCVVNAADGSVHPLQLTNEATTGIKILPVHIAGGGFTISQSQVKDLNIDFDACASIVVQSNGQYSLQPLVHAGEITSGSVPITGFVSDSASGQPIVSGRAIVALEQPDANGIDRVVMETRADSTGAFSFCPIPSGTYDVVAVAIDGTPRAYAATLISGVPAGTNLSNIPLVATPGAITNAGTLAGAITTASASGATSADITVSALQTVTVSGGTRRITVPDLDAGTTAALASTIALQTAVGTGCPTSTACGSYSFLLPAANPNVAAFSASNMTFAQDTVQPPAFLVDAQATVPGSGGNSDCAQADQTTSTTASNTALVVVAGATATASTINFTSCQ